MIASPLSFFTTSPSTPADDTSSSSSSWSSKMLVIQSNGPFTVGGLPRNNAIVKLWSAGSFSTPPVKNTPLPTTTPLATTTTGTQHGYDGAYRFTGVAVGDFYASVEWKGSLRTYDFYSVPSGIVNGEIVDTQYPTPDLALAALVAQGGGTLRLTRMWDIDQTYSWVHPSGGIHYGLLIKDANINIIGEGDNTGFWAAASGVEVLTVMSTSGATTTRSSRNFYEKFVIRNKSTYDQCKGLVLDRSRRNRYRDLVIGHPNDASGFVSGVISL